MYQRFSDLLVSGTDKRVRNVCADDDERDMFLPFVDLSCVLLLLLPLLLMVLLLLSDGSPANDWRLLVKRFGSCVAATATESCLRDELLLLVVDDVLSTAAVLLFDAWILLLSLRWRFVAGCCVSILYWFYWRFSMGGRKGNVYNQLVIYIHINSMYSTRPF